MRVAEEHLLQHIYTNRTKYVLNRYTSHTRNHTIYNIYITYTLLLHTLGSSSTGEATSFRPPAPPPDNRVLHIHSNIYMCMYK